MMILNVDKFLRNAIFAIFVNQYVGKKVNVKIPHSIAIMQTAIAITAELDKLKHPCLETM